MSTPLPPTPATPPRRSPWLHLARDVVIAIAITLAFKGGFALFHSSIPWVFAITIGLCVAFVVGDRVLNLDGRA